MSEAFLSKTMSFGAVLISIGDEIIYYDENKRLPESRILFEFDDDSYRYTIDENYSVLPKGIILQNILLQNSHQDDTNDHEYIPIDIDFETQSTHSINWRLCYQKRMGIMTAVMAQNGSYQTITHILNSLHISLQKYFVESKQIPLYILRIRCHALSQRLLYFANHPTVWSTCICFSHFCLSLTPSSCNMYTTAFILRSLHKKQTICRCAF